MRLIDADKLKTQWVFGKAEKEEIEKAPTVEAIPIEWIKEWRKRKWFSNKPIEERTVMAMGVRLMLEEWEEENEPNK